MRWEGALEKIAQPRPNKIQKFLWRCELIPTELGRSRVILAGIPTKLRRIMSEDSEAKLIEQVYEGFTPPSAEELDADIGDKFEIETLLGVGGMGAVYKGRQDKLDRNVAIKVLRPIEDDSGQFAKGFQREAQAMAKLDHDNIIGVYDFGETESGLLYFAMEYVEGTDLCDWIKTDKLQQTHTLRWLPKICEALDYAHNKGMVHRDIKPANIMITNEEKVKVADFGLVMTGAADQGGLAMGTPAYSAPEMLENYDAVDHRADVYSLGVLLYEMLTGQAPGDEWVAPTELNPAIDHRLEQVILYCMQPDPEHRYQTAAILGKAVEKIATSPQPKENLMVTAPVKLSGGTITRGENPAAIAQRAYEAQKKQQMTVMGIVAGTLAVVGIAAFIFMKPKNEPPAPPMADRLEDQDTDRDFDAEPEKPVSVAEVNPEPEPEMEPEPEPKKDPAAELARQREAENQAADEEFAQLQADFAKRAAAEVEQPFTAKLKQMHEGYSRALQGQLSRPGVRPEIASAIRSEIQLVSKPEPIQRGADPPMLAKAREAYWEQLKKIEQERDSSQRPLLEAQLVALNEFSNQLVAKGVLEPTTKVKEVREPLLAKLEAMPKVEESAPKPKNAANEPEKSTIPQFEPITLPIEVPFPPKRPSRIGKFVMASQVSGRLRTDAPEILNAVSVASIWGYGAGYGAVDSEGKIQMFQNDNEAVLKMPRSLTNVVQLAIGGEHAVALLENGEVRAWGANFAGQSSVPERLSGVVRVYARSNLSCALTNRGRLVAWGGVRGAFREGLEDVTRVVDFADGNGWALCLQNNGSVELVDPFEQFNRDDQRLVKGLKDVVQVGARKGAESVTAGLALHADGTVTGIGNDGASRVSNLIPKNLPKDIDRIVVGVGPLKDDSPTAVFGTRSRSQGWIVFGRGIENPSAVTDTCKNWFQLWLDKRGQAIGVAPIVEEAPEPVPEPAKMAGDPERMPETIRVSPEGIGDTITLDSALDQVQPGDILWLAPGKYPNSSKGERLNLVGAGNYLLTKPDVTIRGHRSEINTRFRIAASNVKVSGLRVRFLDLGGSAKTEVRDCIFGELNCGNSAATVSNCLIDKLVAGGRNPKRFNNITFFERRPIIIGLGEATFEDCVFAGGQDFQFQFYNNLNRAVIRNSIVSPGRAFGIMTEPRSSNELKRLENPEDFEEHGVSTTACQFFTDPGFMDANARDFRLTENSPGKGKGSSGGDLGVALDDQLWPVGSEDF